MRTLKPGDISLPELRGVRGDLSLEDAIIHSRDVSHPVHGTSQGVSRERLQRVSDAVLRSVAAGVEAPTEPV